MRSSVNWSNTPLAPSLFAMSLRTEGTEVGRSRLLIQSLASVVGAGRSRVSKNLGAGWTQAQEDERGTFYRYLR